MERIKKNKKFFIISKNTEESTTLELKDIFGDPNKYLENNTKYKFGNKQLLNIESPLFKDNKQINLSNIEPKSPKSHSPRRFHSIRNDKRCTSALTPKVEIKIKDLYDDILNKKSKKKNIILRNKLNINNKNKSKTLLKQNSIHFEYKTKNEIIDLFNKFLSNQKNKDFANSLSKKKNIFYLKKKLSFKDVLKQNDEEKKNFENFSKYISKRTHRKEENLLLKRIEDFNNKKYVTNFLEENKLFSDRLGINFWICNLRKSNNNKTEHKVNYVITGKKDKEPWEQIVDSGDMEPVYINDPSISQIKMKNNNTFDEYKIFKKKFPFLKSFNNLKIEGKNLLQKEYNIFVKNCSKDKNIKYRLYKDPLEKKIKYAKEMIYKQNYTPDSKIKIYNKTINYKNI